ncbi:MAG TPA: hypothetical protein V6C90_14260 [Coleofasciculaceae cyanobacterium]
MIDSSQSKFRVSVVMLQGELGEFNWLGSLTEARLLSLQQRWQ